MRLWDLRVKKIRPRRTSFFAEFLVVILNAALVSAALVIHPAVFRNSSLILALFVVASAVFRHTTLISAAFVVVAAIGTLSSLVTTAVVIKSSVFRNPTLISSAFIVHSSGVIHTSHVSSAFVVISFRGNGIYAEHKQGKQGKQGNNEKKNPSFHGLLSIPVGFGIHFSPPKKVKTLEIFVLWDVLFFNFSIECVSISFHNNKVMSADKHM